MYHNIGQGAAAPLTNVGGFAGAWYWSSSEYDDFYAWLQHFGSGDQYYDDKNSFKYYSTTVRAVRAF